MRIKCKRVLSDESSQMFFLNQHFYTIKIVYSLPLLIILVLDFDQRCLHSLPSTAEVDEQAVLLIFIMLILIINHRRFPSFFHIFIGTAGRLHLAILGAASLPFDHCPWRQMASG